jgi:hypothetical protein
MDPISPRDVLTTRRAAIVNEWFAETLKTYPPQTAHLLATVCDPFRNPAGHALRENLAKLFDAAMLSDDWAHAAGVLAELVQLRAVQGFTPDEAVAFVAPLKSITRKVITGLKSCSTGGQAGELGQVITGLKSCSTGGHAGELGQVITGLKSCSTGGQAGEMGHVAQDFSPVHSSALSQLDARIDRLTQLALDMYQACRARMDEIRANEVRRRTWIVGRIANRSEAGRREPESV